ncbi:MAG: tyrosine-type recombinase/integrase [Rhodospirillaceae bacterium]
MQLKLTDTEVNQAHCPEGHSKMEYCDTTVPGLYLLTRASGPTKTYFLRYKNAVGKTAHAKIGRISDVSLADARKKAKALKADIASNNRDPQAETKARKNALTFDELWEHHYVPFAQPRKRSFKRDEQVYRLQIKPELGHVRITHVTRQQVQTLAASCKASGLSAASADHVSKLIRRLLSLAVEWEFIEKNPAKGIQLFNEDNQVEHYLSDAQLRKLLSVLQTDANRPVCQICMFLLSTGCRLNEALTAEWAFIDLDRKTWRVSAANSKSGKARVVPLSDAAVDVLNAVGSQDKHAFVFTNLKTGKRYTHIAHTWQRLRKKAGLPKLRLHDLRHTYASMLVNAGESLYVVQQCLGHADGRVTQRYAHLAPQTLQNAASKASDKIREAMGTAAE